MKLLKKLKNKLNKDRVEEGNVEQNKGVDIFDQILAQSKNQRESSNEIEKDFSHLTLQHALVLFIFTTFIYKITLSLWKIYFEKMSFDYLRTQSEFITISTLLQIYVMSVFIVISVLFLFYLVRLALFMMNLNQDKVTLMHLTYSEFTFNLIKLFLELPFMLLFMYNFYYSTLGSFSNNSLFTWNEVFTLPIWGIVICLFIFLYLQKLYRDFFYAKGFNSKLTHIMLIIVIFIYSGFSIYYFYNNQFALRLDFPKHVFYSSEDSGIKFESNRSIVGIELKEKFSEKKRLLRSDTERLNNVYESSLNFNENYITQGNYVLLIELNPSLGTETKIVEKEFVYQHTGRGKEDFEDYLNRYIGQIILEVGRENFIELQPTIKTLKKSLLKGEDNIEDMEQRLINQINDKNISDEVKYILLDLRREYYNFHATNNPIEYFGGN
ncbi:hypothetical protein [Halobacillus sp. Nhm2S1]|uniref:hypothetical protein n=1 Tax=Halobacillus sp. Nhm2S1 TaxID=2866716 RepID=UPI001C733E20|nr:hypothetical protein [Halobacillus sp. Nhm2S1]MBX0358936.1 hypothetical protein [Halobacillus sp. Nhm2S1]